MYIHVRYTYTRYIYTHTHSLYTLGGPGTHYVDHTCPELTA